MKDYTFRFSITHQTEDNLGRLHLAHHAPEADAKGADRAKRLVAFFHNAKAGIASKQRTQGMNDLWTGIVAKEIRPALELIENKDNTGLASYLASVGCDYTWFGGLSTGLDGFNHWNRDPAVVAQSYFDHLLNLAVALAILPAELPEQGLRGNWGQNIAREPDEVADLVEQELGFSIAPPLGVIPVTGLSRRGRMIHYRHINSLYAALKTRDLVTMNSRDEVSSHSICEYGGGLGFVAYYLWLMGFRDITLLDLPITNVFSGNLLIGLLGESAVSLEGEPASSNQIKIRSGILADKHILGCKFNVSLNQDSFPEIDENVVRFYLHLIHSTTTQWFLSINQEVEHAINDRVKHLSIPKLMADRKKEFQRVARTPNWIRRGYVDETYRVLAAS